MLIHGHVLIHPGFHMSSTLLGWCIHIKPPKHPTVNLTITLRTRHPLALPGDPASALEAEAEVAIF
jgi:hypothetical protein